MYYMHCPAELCTKGASANGGLSGMEISKKRIITCSSRSKILRLKMEFLFKYGTAKMMPWCALPVSILMLRFSFWTINHSFPASREPTDSMSLWPQILNSLKESKFSVWSGRKYLAFDLQWPDIAAISLSFRDAWTKGSHLRMKLSVKILRLSFN